MKILISLSGYLSNVCRMKQCTCLIVVEGLVTIQRKSDEVIVDNEMNKGAGNNCTSEQWLEKPFPLEPLRLREIYESNLSTAYLQQGVKQVYRHHLATWSELFLFEGADKRADIYHATPKAVTCWPPTWIQLSVICWVAGVKNQFMLRKQVEMKRNKNVDSAAKRRTRKAEFLLCLLQESLTLDTAPRTTIWA